MQPKQPGESQERPPVRSIDGMVLPPVQTGSVQPVPPPTVSHGRPVAAAPSQAPRPSAETPELVAAAASDEPLLAPAPSAKRSPKRTALYWIAGFVVLLAIAMGLAYTWYTSALKPVDTSSAAKDVPVVIESGMLPAQIAERLKEKGVIRNATAFMVYVRLSDTRNSLQAGSYTLSTGDSVEQTVKKLLNASADEFSVTLIPGETLAGHKQALIAAGYSEAEVTAALAKSYEVPVAKARPAGATLEGYLYGDTHQFARGVTVDTVIERFLLDLQAKVDENDLEAKYRAQGMSLHEGIILASIVQKEVSSREDSAKVAQVFYTRLATGMPLGADATFVYVAKKEGRTPSVNDPSPYNTRLVKGLPPGPISTPGIEALLAVGAPANTDYVYFVSGDDGKNYFSKTLGEHERLTRQYCQQNCALF